MQSANQGGQMPVNGVSINTLGEVVYLPRKVAADEVIGCGYFVGYGAGGYLISVPADAEGETVQGIVSSPIGVDATGLADGAVSVNIMYNPTVYLTLAGASMADVGSLVYPAAVHSTVTLTGSHSPVGRIIDFDGTYVIVDMADKG